VSETIWGQANPTGVTGYTTASQGNNSYGLYFTVSQAGTLEAIWFYSPATGTSLPSSVALYSTTTGSPGSGTLIVQNSSPSWSGAAGSGWVRTAVTATPLTAGTIYVAQYYVSSLGVLQGYLYTGSAPAAWFPSTSAGGHITAPEDVSSTTYCNGPYLNGSDAYPSSTITANVNWLLDVEVSFAAATPPPRPGAPARGRAATRRGRSSGTPGAPYTPPPPVTPSPFAAPRGPAHGAQALRRGRSSGTPGAPYTAPPPVTPSPLAPPRGPSRGRPAVRRGRSSGTPGAPYTAPPPKTLLISLASAAGTDQYGNSYPQGIYASAGVIEGPEFIGSDFIINTSGAFFYSGTPAAGNLLASIANTAGTDAKGNAYVQGTASYLTGSTCYALANIGGAMVWYSASSEAGPWTYSGQLEIGAAGELVIDFASIIGALNIPQSAPTGYPLPTDPNTGSSWATGERGYINNCVNMINALYAVLENAGVI
jgi:hypothetical protein